MQAFGLEYLRSCFYCLGYLMTNSQCFWPAKKILKLKGKENTCCQVHDTVFFCLCCKQILEYNVMYHFQISFIEVFQILDVLDVLWVKLVQFHQLSVSLALCALVCQSFTVNIFKKSVFITSFSFYKAYFQICYWNIIKEVSGLFFLRSHQMRCCLTCLHVPKKSEYFW